MLGVRQILVGPFFPVKEFLSQIIYEINHIRIKFIISRHLFLSNLFHEHASWPLHIFTPLKRPRQHNYSGVWQVLKSSMRTRHDRVFFGTIRMRTNLVNFKDFENQQKI